MDAVEGSGEDEGVVGGEVLEAGGEGAVVDQAAGFVDYEEGEDDPVGVLVCGGAGTGKYVILTLWPCVAVAR